MDTEVHAHGNQFVSDGADGLSSAWSQFVRHPLLLLTLLGLGIAVRLRQYLGASSYWHDEALLLVVIYEQSWGDLLGPTQTQTIIPPFFLWLLRGAYLSLGPGELAMRLPAFVAGMAGLAVMVPLARRFAGSAASILLIGFCALSSH